jgi:hypothetical protein
MNKKYTPKLIFIFILLAQICFGQKVFKIKEGQLQFINPEKGIYIKKNDLYYQVQLQDISYYKNLSKDLKYELKNVTSKEIEDVKKDAATINASEIVKFDFKKLDNQKFTTKNDVNEDDNYRLYKYNKNFFAVSILEDSIQHPRNEYLLHYCILDFGAQNKVIYQPEGFIVPTKEKIRFLFDKGDLNDSFNNYETTVYKDLNAIDMQLVNSRDLELNGHFYKIDTLKNKQLRIKDLYNQTAINQSFDSIKSTAYFIIGYKKGKIEIYNYAFKKFNLKNVRAFNFGNFYPSLQIIEGNTLRRINLIGEDYKKEDLSYIASGTHYFPDMNITFKITSENNDFYIYGGEMGSLVPNFSGSGGRYKLYNREQFETIQFADEGLQFITSYSEMMGTTMSYPIYLYTKLKNGKFNLNTLDYLIAENPDKEVETFNNKLPKNCDAITPLGVYLIEKEGLFTYYPIMKEIKYKKLEDFKGNYARFELPNGQKGWLDFQGKEYLDIVSDLPVENK